VRILFITFSDINVCSSSNIRNVSLIQGLLELGHSIDIISYKSSNTAVVVDKSFEPIISRCNVIEVKANLSTEKVSSNLLSSGESSIKRKLYNKLRKIYYSMEYIDSFRKIASSIDIDKMTLDNYDLMISSSNPYSVHILADRIRNKFFNGKLKWVEYWGDALYLDTLTRKPLFPSKVKKAEKKLISACDRVVYTNQVVLDLQKKLFPEFSSKMVFIETPFAFCKEKSELIDYEVGYFGSYSSNVRDIMPLYNALKNMPYKSIIVGNGDQHIESVNNLTVLPRATVDEVAELEKHTRILSCVCNKLSKDGETGCIPGKTYHYGSSTKEVLVIGATPKVEEFLRKYQRYIFVKNDSDSIINTINNLLFEDMKEQKPLAECLPVNAAKKLLDYISN